MGDVAKNIKVELDFVTDINAVLKAREQLNSLNKAFKTNSKSINEFQNFIGKQKLTLDDMANTMAKYNKKLDENSRRNKASAARQKDLIKLSVETDQSLAEINKRFNRVKYGGEQYQRLKKQIKDTHRETIALKKQSKVLFGAFESFSVSLPLLFGFQQISQGIQNLIDPAMEMLGIQQLERQFLALKYLPTAEKQLDKVLETGEAWLDQDESIREVEGDMLLFTKQISDAIAYTAQWASIMAAIGEAFPLIGREVGAIAGVTIGLTGSFQTLSSDTGQVLSYFQGMEAAVASINSELITGAYVNTLKWADSLGLVNHDIVDTREEVDWLVSQIDYLSQGTLIDIGVNLAVNDPELWEYLKQKSGIAGKDFPVSKVEEKAKITSPGLAYLKAPLTSDIYGEAVKNAPISVAPPTPPPNEHEKGLNWKNIVSGAVGGIAGGLVGILGGPVGIAAGASIGTALGLQVGNLFGGNFKTGGVVPGRLNEPVPIMAHGGERIVPVSGSSNSSGAVYAPNITVNAVVSSDIDVRKLATDLNKYWVADFNRLTQSRATL